MHNIKVAKGYKEGVATGALFDAVRGRPLPNGWTPEIKRGYTAGEQAVVIRDALGDIVVSGTADQYDI